MTGLWPVYNRNIEIAENITTIQWNVKENTLLIQFSEIQAIALVYDYDLSHRNMK